MTEVFVSIGSNIDPAVNVRGAVETLRRRFGCLQVSGVYQSKAVGFDGPDFYNLVVGFDTQLPIHDLRAVLRDVERVYGRVRQQTGYASRTLDLDLLLYGDEILREQGVELPRAEITEQAFVLGPLAEIAGTRVHPALGVTFRELWARFGRSKGGLTAVALTLG